MNAERAFKPLRVGPLTRLVGYFNLLNVISRSIFLLCIFLLLCIQRYYYRSPFNKKECSLCESLILFIII